MPIIKPQGTYSVVKANYNNKLLVLKDIIACYTFDDKSSNDFCGDYNATWHGNKLYDEGIKGFSAKFDGKSYIDTGISSFSTNVSISFWIKMSSEPSEQRCIIHFSIDGKNTLSFWEKDGDGNKFSLVVNDSNVGTLSKNLFDNMWHHIVLTNKTIYVDGEKENIDYNVDMTTINKSLLLGADRDTDGSINNFYLGLIDQVSIYNRLLTEDEIKQLYNNPNNEDIYALQGGDKVGDDYQLELDVLYPEISSNLSSGATACYTFDDETANDSCGNNNGTWIGNEQYTTGIISKAAKFDGKSYIDTGLNLKGNESISLWINIYGEDISSIDQRIWTNNTVNSGIAGLNISKGQLEYYNHNGVIQIRVDFNSDTKFHHIVIDLGNDIMYIDGVKYEKNVSDSSSRKDGANTLWLGMYDGTENQYFKGSIDEVRIFNEALTEDEIQNLYKNPNISLLDDCNLGKILHIIWGNLTSQGKLYINGQEVEKDSL